MIPLRCFTGNCGPITPCFTGCVKKDFREGGGSSSIYQTMMTSSPIEAQSSSMELGNLMMDRTGTAKPAVALTRPPGGFVYHPTEFSAEVDHPDCIFSYRSSSDGGRGKPALAAVPASAHALDPALLLYFAFSLAGEVQGEDQQLPHQQQLQRQRWGSWGELEAGRWGRLATIGEVSEPEAAAATEEAEDLVAELEQAQDN